MCGMVCVLAVLPGSSPRSAYAQRAASDVVVAPPLRPVQAIPAITGMDVLDAGVPAAKVRVEQIQLLVELIAQTPDVDVDEKADMYRRLAEVYSSLYRRALVEATQRRAEANLAIEQKDYVALRDAATALETQATVAFDRAVATYRKLVDNDALRSYPAMDKALFSLSCLLLRNGRLQDARRTIDNLIKNFPTSPELPNTYMLMGDQLMANGNFKLAAKVYERTLQAPGATGYWYAMYQLGALALADHRDKEAQKIFNDVLVGTSQGGAAAVMVRNAAQRALQQ